VKVYFSFLSIYLTHETNAFFNVNLLCWWNLFFPFLDLDSSLVRGEGGFRIANLV
jgi:hypothetical protein